jgi:hypothetical protein
MQMQVMQMLALAEIGVNPGGFGLRFGIESD